MDSTSSRPEPSEHPDRVGIVGGTGPSGMALATQLALLDRPVLLGSRRPERAADAIAEIGRRLGHGDAPLVAVDNEDAARCPLVVLAVSARHTLATASSLADHLRGAIVVSMASAMRAGSRGFAPDDELGGSIAVRLQQGLPQSRVVAGFQHLPAALLGEPSVRLAGDVLLCSDDVDAVTTVIERFAGIVAGRLVDGGVLANAVAVESMTAVLVTLNIRERATYTIRLVNEAASVSRPSRPA